MSADTICAAKANTIRYSVLRIVAKSSEPKPSKRNMLFEKLHYLALFILCLSILPKVADARWSRGKRRKHGSEDEFCPEKRRYPKIFDSARIQFEKTIGIEPITTGFAILEGPVWTKNTLLVSHIGYSTDGSPSPSDLLSYDPVSRQVRVERKDYGSNGMTLDMRRKVLVARHATGTVDELYKGRTVVGGYDGFRFNSPNDLVMSSTRNLYLTDPDWQAGANASQAFERAYFVDTRRQRIAAFATNIVDKPNGVYLSKDETRVFVGGTNGLFAFKLNSRGAPMALYTRIQKEVIQGDVDGMSRDCVGNLYVATNGTLVVLSPGGYNILGSFDLPGITNVAFGGSDGKTLYATTLGEIPSIWEAKVDIPGLPF